MLDNYSWGVLPGQYNVKTIANPLYIKEFTNLNLPQINNIVYPDYSPALLPADSGYHAKVAVINRYESKSQEHYLLNLMASHWKIELFFKPLVTPIREDTYRGYFHSDPTSWEKWTKDPFLLKEDFNNIKKCLYKLKAKLNIKDGMDGDKIDRMVLSPKILEKKKIGIFWLNNLKTFDYRGMTTIFYYYIMSGDKLLGGKKLLSKFLVPASSLLTPEVLAGYNTEEFRKFVNVPGLDAASGLYYNLVYLYHFQALILLPPGFDAKLYAEKNPDLPFNNSYDYKMHYHRHGRFEGRPHQ